MENDQQEHHDHQFVPYEILIGILSRLPADSILQFKRVCKAWRSIIEEDPVFHDMCLRRLISSSDNNYSTSSLGFVTLDTFRSPYNVCYAEYKHDDDDDVDDHHHHQKKGMNFKKWRLPAFKDDYSGKIIDKKKDYSGKIHENLIIVGSCNGLICISAIPYNDHHHLTLVCNPLTGEVVNLSQDSSIINSLSLEGIGFGYLPSTNEYKIVRIYASSQDGIIKHVQVYTLGSGRWRFIVPQIRSSSSWSDISFSPIPRYPTRESRFGVSFNGVLYFNNLTDIVSFDLATEEFRITVSPPPTLPFTTDIGIGGIGGLGVLEGRLCATYSRYFISSTMTTSFIINTDLWVLMEDLWVLMEEKDDKEMEDFPNWIKKFSLPPQRADGPYSLYYYRPLGTISPPRILLQSIPSRSKGIVSYNPETDHLCCRDIDGDRRMVIPYVKSCVSLKALGETLQGKI